ncbi:MAG TPA: CsbD family protein [Mycobacteriales bacterium]|nr:CsbD family protein [Mycobacteriales bacterium]
MGIDDKVDNAKDRVTGRAKETAGAATDNERLRDEGRGQQTEADIKDAGENVKDAARKAGGAFSR